MQRVEAYRIYVTDALCSLAGLNIRYEDMLSSGSGKDLDPVSVREHIKGKLGGKL